MTEIDVKTRDMIQTTKNHIAAMLTERLQLRANGVVMASEYWASFCDKFDYMLGMAEESFLKLRLHTYHLTGDNYQQYFFMDDPDIFLEQWRELTNQRADEYIVSEPREAGGFGVVCNDRLVNLDVIRFQTAINSLYDSNIIQQLKQDNKRKFLLEIGAGYGGFACHLSRLLGNTTYIIVDLPEVLLFSAIYISLLGREKRIYVYNPKDYAEIVERPDFIREYDFVFIPNYRIDLLKSFQFDLITNIASLQEMRTEQVDEYLNFIAEHCKGWFYSWNQDAQPKNKELSSLTEMLKARFSVHNVTSITSQQKEPSASPYTRFKTIARKWAAALKLVEPSANQRRQPSSAPYIQYVCTPLHHLK